jgi:hypothetical protein
LAANGFVDVKTSPAVSPAAQNDVDTQETVSIATASSMTERAHVGILAVNVADVSASPDWFTTMQNAAVGHDADVA